MQIREIKIDGFGMFAKKTISGLSSGINVLYGSNEFGKTTLLEFVRRTLFGFPKKSANLNSYPPLGGGVYGGSLTCQMADKEPIVISRKGGNGYAGDVKVSWQQNELVGQECLDEFLGHASKDIFHNIYAFTLDELQDFASLKGDEIKNRIYGVGLGLGSLSLSSVQDGFAARCDELFRPRGSKQKMSGLYSEVKNLEKEIREMQSSLSEYDELVTRLTDQENEKDQLESKIESLETVRRELEVRQDLFPVVLELLRAESELESLEEIPDFPEDGLTKLVSLQSAWENLQQRVREEQEAYGNLKNDLDVVSVNNDLLEMESDVVFLQQSLKEVGSAAKDRMSVELDKENVADEIEMTLKEIGSGWTEQMAIDFEISQSEKDQIKIFSEALGVLDKEVRSAKDKLDFHREHQAGEFSKGTTIPGWLKTFTYWLAGLGVSFLLLGVILENYLVAGLGGLFAVFGLVLFLKINKEKSSFVKEDKLDFTYEVKLQRAVAEEENKFQEWRAWLREKHFDENLTPLSAEKVLVRIKDIKAMISSRAGFDLRIEKMKETEKEVTEVIGKFKSVLRSSELHQDTLTNIEIVHRLFEQSKKEQEKKSHLEKQIRSQENKVTKLEKELADQEKKLKEFIRSVNAEDENDFRKKYKAVERRNNLLKVVDEKKGFVHAKVGLGESYSKFVESIRSTDPEKNNHELTKVTAQWEEHGLARDRLNQTIGETRNKISQLTSNDELLAKQNDLESQKQLLNQWSREWTVMKIAQTMLTRAKNNYEKTRQPGVIKAAEAIFSKVTDKRYRHIIKPLDSDGLFIDDGKGQRKGIVEMSRGTREQLYLSMRFGLIEEYESRSEPLPLIMDDVFVNFDDERRERVVKVLRNFAQTRQVIVLSCHQHSLNTYKENGANQILVK